MEPRRATIDDVWRKAEDHSIRRLPRVLAGALRLVREAAPRELTLSFALQVGTGAGVAVQLLLGRRLLDDILRADRLQMGLTDVLPTLEIFLTVTGLLQFGYSARSELQRVLGELAGRHAQDHIYSPTAGRILWDGVDTSTCNPTDVRRHMAVIFQDFAQYCLSARDNIAVGGHERADDLHAIVGAARESGGRRVPLTVA